jgi:asparagine synthase (glutamine-hydrolysing)
MWPWRSPATVATSSSPVTTASRVGRLRRLADAASHKSPASQYRNLVQIFSARQIALLWPDAVDRVLHAPPLPDWPDDADPARAAMRWDAANYLPFDLLRKVDRASMAVALEVRCPLLDTAVCELAGRLPLDTLMPGGRPKGLLRSLAGQLLPPDIARRPKRGFAIPIGRWFRTMLRDSLRESLFAGGLESLGLRRPEIERIEAQHASGRADHTHRLFALLSLSLWCQWRGTKSG